ncbi:MAG: hypothetical protein B6U89_07150 [Desulfurococcales archaeon ex4484_58]|nr:MAG: hypothetical protein B6U89_07150 [Desulfurococcales archaeon ex4484_58]
MFHDETFGRDKIVKKLFRYVEKGGYRYLISVIDYETGSSRIYVDRHIVEKAFASNKFFNNKVYVYMLKYNEATIAVIIFDPLIEEILKEADPEITLNPQKYKHREGEEEAYRIFVSNKE